MSTGPLAWAIRHEFAPSPYPGGLVGTHARRWERIAVNVGPIAVPWWWARDTRDPESRWFLWSPWPGDLVQSPPYIEARWTGQAPTAIGADFVWSCDVAWARDVQAAPGRFDGTDLAPGVRYSLGSTRIEHPDLSVCAVQVGAEIVRAALARKGGA